MLPDHGHEECEGNEHKELLQTCVDPRAHSTTGTNYIRLAPYSAVVLDGLVDDDTQDVVVQQSPEEVFLLGLGATGQAVAGPEESKLCIVGTKLSQGVH